MKSIQEIKSLRDLALSTKEVKAKRSALQKFIEDDIYSAAKAGRSHATIDPSEHTFETLLQLKELGYHIENSTRVLEDHDGNESTHPCILVKW